MSSQSRAQVRQAFGSDRSQCASACCGAHRCEPIQSDQGGNLEAARGEIRVARCDPLIPRWELLMKLRRDPADQDISEWPREIREHQRGTQLPCKRVGLRQAEQDNLSGGHGLRSSVVYSISSFTYRAARRAAEYVDHSLSWDLAQRNSAKCWTSRTRSSGMHSRM